MLILDVETGAQSRALAAPFPRETETFVEKEHGSLKDPVKIAEWKAKQRAAWDDQWKAERDGWAAKCASDGALSRLNGRIVAVGVLHTETGDEPMPIVACDCEEANERALVKFAVDTIEQNEKNGKEVLVTFNGHSFDLPLLFVRAAVNDIPLPFDPQLYLRRYTHRPHTDLRMVLSNWDMRFEGTLNGWCAAFGIACDDETTGADIAAMIERNDETGIIAHCKADLLKTASLAHRLRSARLIY